MRAIALLDGIKSGWNNLARTIIFPFELGSFHHHPSKSPSIYTHIPKGHSTCPKVGCP